MQRVFWTIFSLTLFLIVASSLIYGYFALYVLDNPESVGNWFGRLLNGISGHKSQLAICQMEPIIMWGYHISEIHRMCITIWEG